MNAYILFAIIAILIVAVITFFVFTWISTYNELVKRKNKVKNSWANIDAQLQRRFDLIPSLVETVKAFAKHEKQLIETMSANRNNFLNANGNSEKLAINAELTANLKSLSAMADVYPQLKADTNFLKLQSSLAEIEEDITYARQFYNDAVTIYNNKLMSFPANMIAKKHGFTEEVLFDAVKEAETAPNISFKTRKNLEDSRCPVCGAIVGDYDMSCKYCGASLAE